MEKSNNKKVKIYILQRSSISPTEREKYRPRTPDQHEMKKVKKEEKDLGHVRQFFFLNPKFLLIFFIHPPHSNQMVKNQTKI